MKPEIKELREKVKALKKELYIIINNCNHIVVPYTPYDPNDKWFSSSVFCDICGETLNGWYCHTSPFKVCEYHDNYDDCIYYHQPQERK